jgi:hypothetical protein
MRENMAGVDFKEKRASIERKNGKKQNKTNHKAVD